METITFFGGDSQVGTSMIAQAVTEELTKRKQRSLCICASGNMGDDFYQNPQGKSIDDIRANLISGNLTWTELEQVIVHSKEKDILPTVRNPFTAEFYSEKTLNHIIDAAKEHYDYLIADGGSNGNLGLSVSTLSGEGQIFFVLTQQEKTLGRFGYIKREVLDPLELKGTLIINKYMSNIALLSCGEIERNYGLSQTLTVAYDERGWEAEIMRETLMSHSTFQREIRKVCDRIQGKEVKEESWKKSFGLKNISMRRQKNREV